MSALSPEGAFGAAFFVPITEDEMRNRLMLTGLLALIACVAATPAPAPAAPAAAPAIRNMNSRAAPVLVVTDGPPATARDASVVRGSLNAVMETHTSGEIIQGLELESRSLSRHQGHRDEARNVRHEHLTHAEVHDNAEDQRRHRARHAARVAHTEPRERLTLRTGT